ncbi:MAG: hypothetical protein WCD11_31995 [Solirubrobacteraceae bacterium]
MSDHTRGHRHAFAAGALAGLAVAAVIAGCGSASPASSSSVGDTTRARALDQLRQDLVKFADCMRSHGVSAFPDPTTPGAAKEFILSQIPGVDTRSPAFQSAHGTCVHLLPSNGPNPQRATEQVTTQLLRTSRCMRAHGVAEFPDPTTSPPSNQAAYFDVAGFGGPNSPPGAPPVAYLAIPNSINPNSPATERAATACHWRLQ